MTDIKHTPGPWTVTGQIKLVGDPNADGAWNLYCADVLPTTGDFIGNICNIQSADHVKGISREEAAANARLIAAAPDLLDALKELVETLRAEAPGTILNNHRFDGLGIKCNRAIAKAEGRS